MAQSHLYFILSHLYFILQPVQKSVGSTKTGVLQASLKFNSQKEKSVSPSKFSCGYLENLHTHVM